MEWGFGWNKGRIDLINHILGTNAEKHQDLPDWFIKALFVEKGLSEAWIKEYTSEEV